MNSITMNKDPNLFSTQVDSVPDTEFQRMRELAVQLIDVCEQKNREYGSSWCQRGGIGAFFTVWRKADRLEAQLKKNGFNIFDVSVDESTTESLDETIRDFTAYLLLVLEKREAIRRHLQVTDNVEKFGTMQVRTPVEPEESAAHPTHYGYVCQD